MYDNNKFYITDKVRFDYNLINNSKIELKSKFNMLTGEIEELPLKGEYYNMKVDIFKQNSAITGSPHKLFNIINQDTEQNYNDFSFCDFLLISEWMCEDLFINPKETHLTNLELGFNIHVPFDADDFLNQMLLMFNFKAPNRNETFNGRGNYREFKKSDYSFKIYNKSKQFKLNENILRFELKITKSRKLNAMGIYTLNDLYNLENANTLFEQFLSYFEQLFIIDLEASKITTQKGYNGVLNNYTNPNYWLNLKKEKSRNVFNRNKAKCIEYIELNNLDTTKKITKNLLISKFYNLMNCYDGFTQLSA